jgi:hypothetical protein
MRRHDIASSLILVPINQDSEAFASLFFKFTDRISAKETAQILYPAYKDVE